jgi:hypothetical protein
MVYMGMLLDSSCFWISGGRPYNVAVGGGDDADDGDAVDEVDEDDPDESFV